MKIKYIIIENEVHNQSYQGERLSLSDNLPLNFF